MDAPCCLGLALMPDRRDPNLTKENAVTQKPPSEPITLISLDEARARGSQIQTPDAIDKNPHTLEIELQGLEAESAAARSQVESVTKAVASLTTARTRREQFDPIYMRSAESWVAAEKEVKRTEDEIDERRRMLPLLPFGSGVVFLILLVIAAAEFVLNRAAFEITGEDSLNIDVLAVAVGVGLVTAAHFLGIALRRLVDRLPGTALSPVALLVASVGGSLLIAILAINALREAFFAESELPVPGGALAWLQVFLLWVAVALSAAHANPLRENLTRTRVAATTQRKVFEKTRSEWTGLFNKHAEAHARTWAAVAGAAADADIQAAHTERARQAFAQGANGALDPAEPTPNRIARSWSQWLDQNPMDLATPTVLVEAEKLIAQVTSEAALTTRRPEADATTSQGETDEATDHRQPADESASEDDINHDEQVDLSLLESEFDQIEVGQ